MDHPCRLLGSEDLEDEAVIEAFARLHDL